MSFPRQITETSESHRARPTALRDRRVVPKWKSRAPVHRSLQRVLSVLAPLAPLLLPGCIAQTDESHGDEELGKVSLAASKFEITEIQTHGCTAIVLFTQAPAVSGKSLIYHRLERRRKTGSTYTPWSTVQEALAVDTKITHYRALTNETYQYRIRPIYRNSNGSHYSGDPTAVKTKRTSCDAPRATSGVTHPVRVHLYRPTNVAIPAGLTPEYIEEVIFDESNPGSLFNFLQDVSAGYSHTSLIPQVRIGGTVGAWKYLSKPKSGYPAGRSDMAKEVEPLFQDLNDEDPTTQHIFIFAGAAGGGFTTGKFTTMGTDSLFENDVIGTLAHEFGHALGLMHEPAMNCGGGQPPQSFENLGFCRFGVYSHGQNASSWSRYEVNYYSGMQKLRVGFLKKQNVRWLDVRDLGVGSSKTYDIDTSTRTMGSTARQLVMLKLEHDDTSYVLQYRTAEGFDSESSHALSYKTIPFPAGVFVSLWLGRKVKDVPFDQDALMLYRDDAATYNEPVIVTTDSATTYYDMHRKVEVKVTSMDYASARVVVTRK